MNKYAKIIQREFAAHMSCDASAVSVDMSEDELIRVTYDFETFECDCSGDDSFVFVSQSTDTVIEFAIPADYLE